MIYASLLDIANLVQGLVIGNEKMTIFSLSTLDDIVAGSLVFAENNEKLRLAEKSEAAVILVDKQTVSEVKPVIQVSYPFQAFIQLLEFFYPARKNPISIHPTAVIADDAKIGKNVTIGAYAVIESGVSIADNCIIKNHVSIGHDVVIGQATVLHPHVTIYERCKIGERVIIHASTVIGSDGFGYIFVNGQHKKVPHAGNVIIEDDVEIGANTVIDKATLGSTVIGTGTKVDNLVQIAHSVKLGKANILCAFTGIAGSTVSGEGVVFAANVGVSDHVCIDDGVILTARAGVPPNKHLLKDNIYLGNPARPKDKAVERELSVARIPGIIKQLKKLNDKVAELYERIKNHSA